jgi:hypothetical protein
MLYGACLQVRCIFSSPVAVLEASLIPWSVNTLESGKHDPLNTVYEDAKSQT